MIGQVDSCTATAATVYKESQSLSREHRFYHRSQYRFYIGRVDPQVTDRFTSYICYSLHETCTDPPPQNTAYSDVVASISESYNCDSGYVSISLIPYLQLLSKRLSIVDPSPEFTYLLLFPDFVQLEVEPLCATAFV